jgi:hypothetical protein
MSTNSSTLSKIEKGKDVPELPRPYPMSIKIRKKAKQSQKFSSKKIQSPNAIKTRTSKKNHNNIEFYENHIWREGESTPLSTLSISSQGYSPTKPHKENSQNSASSQNHWGQFIQIDKNSKSRGLKSRKHKHTHKKKHKKHINIKKINKNKQK